MPGGPEVVQQDDFFDVQFALENFRIHSPGKIRRSNVIIDYRSGHAESGGHNWVRSDVRRRLAREFPHDQFELRELFARKPLFEYGCEPSVLLRKKREVALRAPNVPGKDHLAPCPLCLSWRCCACALIAVVKN
jgi:hypothetical protein